MLLFIIIIIIIIVIIIAGLHVCCQLGCTQTTTWGGTNLHVECQATLNLLVHSALWQLHDCFTDGLGMRC